MRKITVLAIISILAFANTNLKAQNSDHPWAIGVYMNWVDFNVVHMPVADQFTNANWQGKDVKMIPSKFTIGRSLSPSFNLVAAFSINKLELAKMESLGQPLKNNKFWDADATLEYKLANGYILKESSWFDPYAYVGFGVTNLNEVAYLKQVTGVGFNFWVLPNLGLNFHGSYDFLFERDDYAHYAAGLKLRLGAAKDTDKDGVADKEDRCPTEFGLVALKGCPDTDGDGIADMDDKCPLTPAGVTVDAMGCPVDSDSDGVADYLDKCSDTPAGVKVDEKGCPVDSDSDGVADYLDKCPNTPIGVKVDANGCTVDTDNDGVSNDLDKCPDTPAGVKVDAAGCPLDIDKDGVPDYLDKCPTVPGIAANSGCPEIKKEEQEIINTAFSNLEFVSAKWIIKKVSYPSLSRLAELLKKKPDWKVQLSGHTDSDGADAANMTLSENRANAVKEFLVAKGVPEDRIKTEFFGESNPIAPNTTAAGKQKNRRVEMAIFF